MEEGVGKSWKKRKFNCYATIIQEKKKYFTINGIEDEGNNIDPNLEKTITIIKKLLKNQTTLFDELMYVGISDDTRYYLPSKGNITYKDFKALKKLEGDEKLKEYNRMFTCCERKLLAKVLNSTEQIRLTIVKAPCRFCQREIDTFDNLIVESPDWHTRCDNEAERIKQQVGK